MIESSLFDRAIIRRVLKANLFRPRNDHVIAFRTKLTQTAGGVFLPETVSPKGSMGFTTLMVVIACGPGRFIELTGEREPIDLSPGDLILISAQAGLELGEVIRRELGPELSQEELRLIRAHDIIADLPGRNVLNREV